MKNRKTKTIGSKNHLSSKKLEPQQTKRHIMLERHCSRKMAIEFRKKTFGI